MRKLNKKQEKLCIEYIKNGGNPFNLANNKGLELKRKLEQINDYETLYQDIDRFLMDYDYNEKYNVKG